MNRVSAELAMPVGIEAAASHSPMSDFLVLTKARLTMMVLVTTFVGVLWGGGASLGWMLVTATLVGTGLVAAAAQALNQVIEKDVDRLMERTRNRPLPAGRMSSRTALRIGVLLAAAGLAILWWGVSPLCATLAAATLAVYLGMYTPMKRRTPLCIAVGAVAGALPPMIGWAAATGGLEAGAWILFGVLFCWQMPHFLAIAWMYRDEYAGAGFVLLRRNDTHGVATAAESVIFSLALTAVTVWPVVSGIAHPWYLVVVIPLNAALFFCAAAFLSDRSRVRARRLFFASLIYLPAVLGPLVFAKP